MFNIFEITYQLFIYLTRLPDMIHPALRPIPASGLFPPSRRSHMTPCDLAGDNNRYDKYPSYEFNFLVIK